MRRILLFWGVILIALILGVAAIVYSRILLIEAERIEEEIREELAMPKVHRMPGLPVPPFGPEMGEVPVEPLEIP